MSNIRGVDVYIIASLSECQDIFIILHKGEYEI